MTYFEKKRELQKAFRDSTPVAFGYIPIGVTFGVLFASTGQHWIYAVLLSLVVYAGAAQFMAVGLIAAHASFVEVFVSTFILNARHFFYGLSLIHTYICKYPAKFYLIFGLTDETYSLITANKATTGRSTTYLVGITFFNQLYWTAGTLIGAALGEGLAISVKGLDFVLTALFTVLAIEQLLANRNLTLFFGAIFIAVATAIFIPNYMLIAAIGISGVILLVLAKGKHDR